VNDYLAIALLGVCAVATMIAFLGPWPIEWELASGSVGIVGLMSLILWLLRR